MGYSKSVSVFLFFEVSGFVPDCITYPINGFTNGRVRYYAEGKAGRQKQVRGRLTKQTLMGRCDESVTNATCTFGSLSYSENRKFHRLSRQKQGTTAKAKSSLKTFGID